MSANQGGDRIGMRQVDAAVSIRPSTPAYAERGSFLRDVRAGVEQRFSGVQLAGGARLYRKAAVIILWFAASLALLLTAADFAYRVCAAVSLGGASTAIGFSVFHDANHGAFARRRALNVAAAIVCSILIGPARHIWCVKHNVLHHRHPNVIDWDDDLEGRGVLRFTPAVPWTPKFRFQSLYAPALYALNTIEWIFLKDFVQYFRGELNKSQLLPPMRPTDHAEFWLAKAAYAAIVVAPPFFVMPWTQAVVCFLVFHAVFGLSVSLIFLPSHLTRDMAFSGPQPGADWATHQLHTTANYGVGDPLTTWITGGVNYQIEHHLFPHVSHIHYPAIAPMVEDAARAHELPYRRLGSFGSAVAKHFAFMRELGAGPSRFAP